MTYYNSSIHGQGTKCTFDKHIEIPGKIFFNDMSKTWDLPVFATCDCVFSEIAWPYGYDGFNKLANNVPNSYAEYIQNVNRCIEKLSAPSFVVCGKPAKRYFKNASMQEIAITTADTNMKSCTLYTWNVNDLPDVNDTKSLIRWMTKRYRKCLDFSCGYGSHLLNFDDFVACDINRDCLTYLSILYQEKSGGINGKAAN